VEWVISRGVLYDASELLRSVEGSIGPRDAAGEASWRPGG
jgi:hypothetical protein